MVSLLCAFGKLNRIRLRDALPYSHPYPPCHRWLNSLLAIVMARLNSLLAIVLATYTIVLGRVNRSGMPNSSPAVRRLLQLMLLLLLASSVSATSPGTTTVNDFCRGPPPPLVRSCTLTRYGGKEGAKNPYGAWTLCSEMLNRDSHVFSVGIGSDVSFDAAVIKRHGARVSCFDPTITREVFERIIKRHKLSAAQRSLATFYPFGLSESDDVLAFYHHNSSKIASLVSTTGLPGYLKQPWLRAPVLRVQTLQFLANVSRIDVLKMDVEGAEWMMFRRRNKSLRAWLRCSPPRQIAIEFHDRMFRLGKVQREQVVKLLEQCGFTLRHQSLPSKEENLFVRDRVATAKC